MKGQSANRRNYTFFPFRNRAAVAVALPFFIMSMMFGSWIARLPDIKNRLDLSEGQVGLCLLGIALGSLFATPMTVFILRKMHTKTAVFTATAAVCFAFTLPALAQGGLVLFLLLILVGLSEGFLNISMNAAAADLEKRDDIKIMSTCHGMFSLGLAIGAALSGYISRTGFSFFWHIVIIAAVMMTLSAAFRPLLEGVPDGGKDEAGFVFPPKPVLLLGFICMCFNIGEGSVSDWAAVYLRDTIGSDAFTAGLGLAVFSTGMAIGRFSGDFIRARFTSVRILVTGGVVTVIGLLLTVFMTAEWGVLGGLFAAGLGLSLSVPVIYSESTQTEGVAPDVGLAAVATFSIVGFMCGPPLIGFISEMTSLRYGFGFTAMLAALGTVLVLWRR